MQPPPPELLKILAATRDEEASPRKLGLQLEEVQGLVDLLFRYVGVYYTWLGTENRDPSRITVLLGPKVVWSICLQHVAAVQLGALELTPMVGEALGSDLVRRAVAARRLSNLFQDVNADEAFVIGLLSELGQALLLERAASPLVWMREVRVLVGQARYDKELEVFGDSADRVLARAMRSWGLPEDLVLLTSLGRASRDAVPALLLNRWKVMRWSNLLGEALSARDAGSRLDDWVVRVTRALEISDQDAWSIVDFVLARTQSAADVVGLVVGQQPTVSELKDRRAQRPEDMNRSELLSLVKLLEEDNARLNRDREHLRAENRMLTRTDPLTRVPTLMAFRALLERHLILARRNGEPLSLMLFDVDGLVEVNDRLGYDRGDEVLQRVAEVGRKVLRDRDLLARLEGDTFMVLAHADDRGGQLAGERIRAGVEATRIVLGETVVRVTVKVVGVSTARLPDQSSAEGFLVAATRLLKTHREQRGNRVYWG